MKIFYNEKQSCPEAIGYSPSAGKPAQFVADTLTHFPQVEVVRSGPASVTDFLRVHQQDFIEGVLAGHIDNGFGNRSLAVAATLPYTSGSFLNAAQHAALNQEHTCSPTSGFHHAGHAKAQGFCTFNGLLVAAAALHQALGLRVGILDIDRHYGNGTDDIIGKKKLDYVKHHTFGQHFRTTRDCAGGKFEGWLADAISDLQDCDLILYQAGADPHIDDPLGGCLTTAQMRQRDRQVFQSFKGKGLVWNLAGGYQKDANGGIEPVLSLHRHTVEEWLDANPGRI